VTTVCSFTELHNFPNIWFNNGFSNLVLPGKIEKIINKFVISNWAICVAIELGEFSIFLIIKVSFDLAVVLPFYHENNSLACF
jgi:hypothetical protein